MSTVYIGVGSNIGDRQKFIDHALWFLRESENIKVINTSSIYETEPEVGQVGRAQGKFLNIVVEIQTKRPPQDLLYLLKSIERKLGRADSPLKWAPREIDLDILLYDDLIVSTDELMIPHPLMHERIFVLEPLCEIAKYAIHPAFNRSIEQLLDILNERNKTDESN